MAGKRRKKQKGKKHPSLSEVQDRAEAAALELIKAKHGYSTLERRKIDIGNEKCQPDGVNSTGKKVVEVYARVGKLKGAQSKKVATDILKLATIRRQPGFETARCEIYFVDSEALNSVRGWMKEAAEQFGVQLKIVEGFPDDLRKDLVKAQERQATGTTKKK